MKNKTWTLKQQMHLEDITDALQLVHEARMRLACAITMLKPHSGREVELAYNEIMDARSNSERAECYLAPHQSGMAQAKEDAATA